MEPVLYVMAIMGCGDAGGLCSQARLDSVRYTSLQACQAAAPATLQRHVDLDFPEISAQCRISNVRDTRQIAASQKPGYQGPGYQTIAQPAR